MPLRGQLEGGVGRDNIVCNPNVGTVISPTHEVVGYCRRPIATAFQLSLSKPVLTRQLAALLGKPPFAALEFAPSIDLTTGYGRSLARYVLMVVADLEQRGSVLWNPTTMSSFEQFITTALLLSHPHNYSDALRRLEKAIAARDVTRAIDYIEAYLERAVTVVNLVAATGLPAAHSSCISRIFQGISPMHYLRKRALEASSPSPVAIRYGCQCH